MEKFSSDNVHSKFVLRTPSFPLRIDELSDDYLMKSFNDPLIKEALYIASPFLYAELDKLYKGEIKDVKKINKLLMSFAKYCSRMQSRCTPYGLFASCSIGTFSEKTKIIIPGTNDRERTNRHTRPDMNFLCEFSHYLTLNDNIRALLKFYPNSSIYKIGDQLRYIEYKFKNRKRLYQISSVSDSDYLQLVLRNSEAGIKINEIARLLISEEISEEESLSFVNELIDNQLLISELEPSLTGPEFIYQLINRLTAINKVENNSEISSTIHLLVKLQEKLDSCDSNRINDISFYRDIFLELTSAGIKTEEDELFQVDLYKNNLFCELSNSIKEDIVKAFNFLDKLVPASDNGGLKLFKENFFKRYETEEVPLLEALDTETGIGFPSKDHSGTSILIDDLNTKQGTSAQPSLSWKKKDQLLLQKYLTAYKNESHSIQIDDSDINGFNDNSVSLPHTFSVIFRVLNEKGKLQIINWGSSSAANILGRFAHGSREIEGIISEVVAFEKEQIPDKIVAEILHLPYSRLGNILLRPAFREYEIPYLAKSTLDKDYQIPVSDLYLSIKNDRIILRSKRLNKEVIPRLTTAHNYVFNTLPLYQFLGELQGQYFEKRNLNFDWGMVDSIASFLPRVEYKNVILSAAKWKLVKSDFSHLLKSEKVSREEITSWRLNYKIPAKAVISEDDNELLIDFGNSLSIKIFIEFIRKRNEVTLTEFLYDEENMVVKDSADNKYTNECIAILFTQNIINQTDNGIVSEERHTADLSNIKRQFIIGEDWLYYKFYCGIKSADKLLIKCVKPLTEDLVKNNIISDWFFIRYADPDWHIRLRLRLKNTEEIGKLINSVRRYIKDHIASGMISKVEISNYNRELERYDFSNILIAEKYFHIDSEATVNFLDLTDQQGGDKLRLQFALRSIDDLLSAFRLNLKDKFIIMDQIQSGFVKEHGGEKLLKIQLDNKYRTFKKDIDGILNYDNYPVNEMGPVINILNIKRDKINKVIDELFENFRSNKSSVPINELITSYIHMMLNRLFYARQRTHEMLVYYLLSKYYKSRNILENKEAMNVLSKTH